MRQQQSVPEPKAGDVYETTDPRREVRRLKVVHAHWSGSIWPRVLMRNVRTDRLSTVSIDLLRPGSRGYRKVQEAPR